MNIDVSKLRELLARATPGELAACAANNGKCQCGQVWDEKADAVFAVAAPYGHSDVEFVEDQRLNIRALIVAAVNALPSLLDALEAAEKRCSELEKDRSTYRSELRETQQDRDKLILDRKATIETYYDLTKQRDAALARVEKLEHAGIALEAAEKRCAELEFQCRVASSNGGEALARVEKLEAALREIEGNCSCEDGLCSNCERARAALGPTTGSAEPTPSCSGVPHGWLMTSCACQSKCCLKCAT